MGNNKRDFWLDDDPEWAALRRRVQGAETPMRVEGKDNDVRGRIKSGGQQKTQSYTKPKQEDTESKKVNVSVNLSLPKLPTLKRPTISSKQKKLAALGLAGLLILFIGVRVVPGVISGDKNTEVGDVLSDSSQAPTFEPLLPPEGSEALDNRGVKFDPEKQVVSFAGKVGEVFIVVSQQKMPEDFKASPQEGLKKLAGDIFANEPINLSDGTAYVGTSTKGPQTAIMVRNGLLIFVQSQSRVEPDQWEQLLDSLK